MKIIFLILFTLSTSHICLAELTAKDCNFNLKSVTADEDLVYNKGKPATGYGCFFYADVGSLNLIIAMKDGKAEGMAYRFYPNGKLEQDETYINGMLDGVINTYYESGQLSGRWHVKNDKENGSVETFYEDGTLQYQAEYKDGVVVGTEMFYFENGRINAQVEYQDGVKHGKTTVNGEEGNLSAIIVYDRGEIVSGECRNGDIVTKKLKYAELQNWDNGYAEICEQEFY